MASKDRLVRTENKMIAGVAGGLGRYFELDPTIFRILFVILVFADWLGVVLYLLFWILMPPSKAVQKGKVVRTKKRQRARKVLGIILVVIGTTALLDYYFPIASFNWKIVWSVLILCFGFWLFSKNSGSTSS